MPAFCNTCTCPNAYSDACSDAYSDSISCNASSTTSGRPEPELAADLPERGGVAEVRGPIDELFPIPAFVVEKVRGPLSRRCQQRVGRRRHLCHRLRRRQVWGMIGWLGILCEAL